MHLSNWILKLLSEGKRPIIELIEECEHSVWQEREKYWIKKLNAVEDDQYYNICRGGLGHTCDP